MTPRRQSAVLPSAAPQLASMSPFVGPSIISNPGGRGQQVHTPLITPAGIPLATPFVPSVHAPTTPLVTPVGVPYAYPTARGYPPVIPPPPMSLLPTSSSSRVRGSSHIDFKTATTGVAAKAMRNEIARLVQTVTDRDTQRVRTLSPLSSSCISRRS